MRIFSHHPARLTRAVFVASLALVAAGCGGGSGSGLPNGNQICDSNAGSISIARPTPGFSQNGNAIEIVDSTNTDQLNGFTNQFDLNIVDQSNNSNEVDTGFLTAVADVGGPHPYTNDFFYAGTLNSNLLAGRTYNVFLNAPNTNCTRGLVGQIFT